MLTYNFDALVNLWMTSLGHLIKKVKSNIASLANSKAVDSTHFKVADMTNTQPIVLLSTSNWYILYQIFGSLKTYTLMNGRA